MMGMINCREATALVLQSRDRPLSRRERLVLRLHLWICAPCPKFVKQMDLLNQAVSPWRHYKDTDPGP